MKKWLVLCLALMVLTGFIAACGAKTSEEENQPVVVETELPDPFDNTSEQPEDGQPGPAEEGQEDQVEDLEDIYSSQFTGARPIAVMIDNQGSKVLPQGGLDKAQIVYEVIVEGGLTRLMPVFWGTEPEMIGRSGAQGTISLTSVWNMMPYMFITAEARRQVRTSGI